MSKTNAEAILILNELALNNATNVCRTTAHQSDQSLDAGSGGGDCRRGEIDVAIPAPVSWWKHKISEVSKRKTYNAWVSDSKGHSRLVWRDKFARELERMNRDRLRIATQFISGHATVNYHHKYKRNIPIICPYCGVWRLRRNCRTLCGKVP